MIALWCHFVRVVSTSSKHVYRSSDALVHQAVIVVSEKEKTTETLTAFWAIAEDVGCVLKMCLLAQNVSTDHLIR